MAVLSAPLAPRLSTRALLAGPSANARPASARTRHTLATELSTPRACVPIHCVSRASVPSPSLPKASARVGSTTTGHSTAAASIRGRRSSRSDSGRLQQGSIAAVQGRKDTWQIQDARPDQPLPRQASRSSLRSTQALHSSDFSSVGRRSACSWQSSVGHHQGLSISLRHSKGFSNLRCTRGPRASPVAVVATSEVLEESRTASGTEAEATPKELPKKKTPRPPKPKVVLRSTTMGDQDTVIPGTEREVILQAFNWESHRSWDPSWWGRLAQMVPEIADLGITSVWLPPPSSSLAPQGYLPQDLYKLDSNYGNEYELRGLIQALKERSVKPVLDVVVNHRCGSGQDEEGRWTRYPGLRPEWNEDAVTSDTGGKGSASTGAVFEGIPNIDHTQEFVRADLKGWLAWLRDDVGFTGFRFDFAKGYSPEFVREYLESVRPELAVGEFWTDCNYTGEEGEEHELDYDQDSHRQGIVDWIDGTGGQSAAFDFTTKAILQEAAKTGEWSRLKDERGKAPGLLGFWPSRAVTFIDNHDTGSTQAHWPFPREKITQGYAYILTHPGMPTIFYDHLFEWGEETKSAISTLLACRKRGGVTCDSLLSILKADEECYVAAVGERLVVEIGSTTWVEKNDPEKLYELMAKGTEECPYAVWIDISETTE